MAHGQHSLQLRSLPRRKLFGELGVSGELMFTVRATSGSTGRPNLAEVGRQYRAAKLADEGYNLYLGGSFQTSREGECWPNIRQMQRIAMKAARQGQAPAKAVPEAETDTVGTEGQLLGASSLQHCFCGQADSRRRETLPLHLRLDPWRAVLLQSLTSIQSLSIYIYISSKCRYHTCPTKDSKTPPKQRPEIVRCSPLVLSFSEAYLCDTPFCNILRDNCAIPHKNKHKKCDTIAASIARYERYRYWASKRLGSPRLSSPSFLLVSFVVCFLASYHTLDSRHLLSGDRRGCSHPPPRPQKI